MLKGATAPRLSEAAHRSGSGGAPLVVARPALAGPKRAALGRGGRVPAAARGVVTSALARLGVSPYRASTSSLSLRIPEDVVEPVIAALLALPVVDYVEANQLRPVTFYDGTSGHVGSIGASSAGPQGTNGADAKHAVHDVLRAWDITRGSGAKVGILDSGLAFSNVPGAPQQHPDALPLNSAQGVMAKGFVDDYDAYNDCDRNGTQASGGCPPWDDHWNADVGAAAHGTSMVGVVGANDNDTGTVGIMPDGLTVSIEVTQNCNLSNDGCRNNTFAIEDDDFLAALYWAEDNALDVLSMSFGASFGSAIRDELGRAYYFHNILLVAAVPNQGDNGKTDLVELSHVMGVGGVNAGGDNLDNENLDDRQEVSALASRFPTLGVTCPSPSAFCFPDLSKQTGGTSAATAIVAAIAGLVRADEPSIMADDLRLRLARTAEGPNRVVNARSAVLNIVPPEPLRVTIDGPGFVTSSGTKTWYGNATGGPAPNGQQSYAYVWERADEFEGSRQVVGSGPTYSETVFTGSPGFTLYLTVTAGAESETAIRSVQTSQTDCPPNTLCP